MAWDEEKEGRERERGGGRRKEEGFLFSWMLEEETSALARQSARGVGGGARRGREWMSEVSLA